jgi:hybrid cluster-associated redox disulfide protein
MEDTITREMTIQEVVNNWPETLEVFARYGLGCVGCHIAAFENIEQGAVAHGLDVDALVKDLNAAVAERQKEGAT